MLKYKTKVIDYHSLKTKIPEDRVLTNYIYNNFDFIIIDIAFKTGNLNLVEDYLAHFIKTNNNIFKKIKKWNFANSFKARLYVVDFILTILCRRYILKCDGKIPHIQHLLSTKHLLEQSPEDTNIRNLFAGLVDRRNTISRMLIKIGFLRVRSGAIV